MTTKYGLRDRGHELFYRLISRKKIEVVLHRQTGGPGGPCLGPGRRVASNPGCLYRGIGRVLVTVLKGYWWGIGGYWRVLEGIGAERHVIAKNVALGVTLGIIYKSLYNRDPTVHLDDLGGDSLEP